MEMKFIDRSEHRSGSRKISIMSASMVLALNTAMGMTSEFPEEERFQQLCRSSDLMWCNDDECTLYKSSLTFPREDDVPIGFTITVSDKSFTEEELQKYSHRLMAWWDEVMEEELQKYSHMLMPWRDETMEDLE